MVIIRAQQDLLDQWVDLWRTDTDALLKLQKENERLVLELEKKYADFADQLDEEKKKDKREMAQEMLELISDFLTTMAGENEDASIEN